MLWLFYIDHELEHGTHQGKIEVFLAASADGRSWKRFSDTPLIPLGANGWDSGMITSAGQPVFLTDGVSLYYGGANFDHAAGEHDHLYDQRNHRFSIGFTTLRKDGFVYATASDDRITTKTLAIEKGQIKVNADCTCGKIQIDVNEDGGGQSDSFVIAGIDALAYPLHTAIRGNAKVRIGLENTELYSLEIL